MCVAAFCFFSLSSSTQVSSTHSCCPKKTKKNENSTTSEFVWRQLARVFRDSRESLKNRVSLKKRKKEKASAILYKKTHDCNTHRFNSDHSLQSETSASPCPKQRRNPHCWEPEGEEEVEEEVVEEEHIIPRFRSQLGPPPHAIW